MKRFTAIVESSWSELKLFAESIPHLLHWDYAYLWVLEKPPELRPVSWRARIEAWRYLVSMMVAGELSIVEEGIPLPLKDYTHPFGIDRVFWLTSPRDNRKIGVLSPTVLVRPLPDFKEEDLESWDRRRTVGRLDDEKREIVNQLMSSLIDRLRRDSPKGSYRDRLSAVFDREFARAESRREKSAQPSRPRPNPIHRAFPILKPHTWNTGTTSSTRTGSEFSDSRIVEEIELPIHKGQGSRIHFIPYCSCGRALLQKSGATPLIPTGAEVEILCAHCGETCQLDLEDLLIWNRPEKARVVVWEQDPTLEPPPKGYPPVAKIQSSELVFEWDPSLLAGDKELRFLRLRFPNFVVEMHKVDDAFFTKLLVPGRLDSTFSGLPMRQEWIESVADLTGIEVEVDVPANEVLYRKVKVRGWPTEIKKIYAGELGLEEDPELSVGVFPDPASVCGGWRWHRVFLEGSHRDSYRLSFGGGDEILPTLAESLEGYPEELTVMRRSSSNVGVTFLADRTERPGGGRGTAFLGIDFGTASSLVYFMAADQIAEEIEPVKHAVRPSKLAAMVKWLAGEPASVGGTIGSFLPPDRDAEGRTDPYLVPTALWRLDGRSFIRWSSDAPAPNLKALTGFKWDREGRGDHTFEREEFFSELLLTVVPWILDKLELSTVDQVDVKVGMAFPLAFDPTSRQKMHDLLTELAKKLHAQTGLHFDFYSVNEAIACVEAFGEANKGDTYLIADLGGSTLDVALYTAQGIDNKPDIHQLGSLEFAGETFIEAFATVKESDVERRAGVVWQVRDAILSGESRQLYGKEDSAQRVLGRFRASVFEYLRTMITAFHQQYEGQHVKLVLAGNAWHLSEAFDPNASSATWRTIYRQTYSGLVARLGIDQLEFFDSPEMDALPSTKHFVVKGALKNATSARARRQLQINARDSEVEENRSRLPCGRPMSFSSIGANKGEMRLEWHDLVGEGARFGGFSAPELRDSAVDFELHEIPPLTDKWKAYLLSSFGVNRLEDLPNPTEQRLRAQLVKGLLGDPDSYFCKGPVQLILEQTWKKSLSNV